MDGLEIKSFTLGLFAANAYLIIDKNTRECVLIDAPEDAENILSFIEEQGLTLQFILLTHAHIDHIQGLAQFKVSFYVHEADEPFLHDPGLNLSSMFTPLSIEEQARLMKEGDIIPFGPYYFEVIHTPGHTPGSVCLKLNGYLFSGDTLFFDSIGRSDLPRGDGGILIDSIKKKLFPLAPETVVLPGHGAKTTISRESRRNPFLI